MLSKITLSRFLVEGAFEEKSHVGYPVEVMPKTVKNGAMYVLPNEIPPLG